MRILHIVQQYFPSRGGAEAHLGQISARLAAAGHQVTVLTSDAAHFELFWDPSGPRLPAGETWLEGVRLLRFPVRHLPGAGLSYAGIRRLLWLLSRTPLPPWPARQLCRFTPWVPGLGRWLATTAEPFDLVAGMNIPFENLLWAGQRFARRRGLPFVLYPLTHLGAGSRPGHDPVSTFYTMRHQLALVRASDMVMAQSQAESAFYQGWGLPAERLPVIGPGVDPASVQGGDGGRLRRHLQLSQAPIVASLGTLSYDKGTAHLVQAMGQLWQAGRQVELVLAGRPVASFRHYLARLPASTRDRLHLLEAPDDQGKRDLLAALDVFAMPSRSDSFGLVYLEAWLQQKPVIAADAWGVKELVQDGRDGLLVPFGDVAALAGAIARLLDDPLLAAAMGRRGQARVLQEHTWEQKMPRIAEIYQRLAGPEGRRSA